MEMEDVAFSEHNFTTVTSDRCADFSLGLLFFFLKTTRKELEQNVPPQTVAAAPVQD